MRKMKSHVWKNFQLNDLLEYINIFDMLKNFLQVSLMRHTLTSLQA